VGHRFENGLYITSFGRRSAWPETQIVLNIFWKVHPDRRFVVMKGLWPPARIDRPEPPENELFYMNLWESMLTRAGRWLRVQPGPVVYFIWGSPVDLDNPPAPGDPPSELLEARAETEHQGPLARPALASLVSRHGCSMSIDPTANWSGCVFGLGV
jgi:hypothetical protein